MYIMKNTKTKQIPKFKNEDEEREFWATHSSLDYFDVDHPIKMDFSALKPSTRPITIRLPESLLSSLKIMANKRDVPYQSLMKIILNDRVQEEFRTK